MKYPSLPTLPIPTIAVLPLLFKRPLEVLPWVHRRWGPVVYLGRVSTSPPVVSVADPRVAEHILTRSRTTSVATRGLRHLVGNGLIRSSGDHWLRQRRLMQPAFHRQQVAQMITTIAGETDALLDSWRGTAQVRDLSQAFRRLAQQIIVQLLFGAQLDAATADQTGAAFATVLTTWARGATRLIDWPIITQRANAERDAAITVLDAQVQRMITDRRHAADPGRDLLGMLLAARDEDGSAMTDMDVRDEVMSLFLAGYETTALTLTWFTWLLARHPHIAAQLRAVTQGVDDAQLLSVPLLQAVIHETLRLYPPAWATFRTLETDLEVAPYRFAAGTMMMVLPWVVQRDARWWPEPDAFRPERWLERDPTAPKYTFFPFGGGSRQCLGQGLALAELAVIGTRLVHALQLGAAPALRPVMRGTVQPDQPLRLHITVPNMS